MASTATYNPLPDNTYNSSPYANTDPRQHGSAVFPPRKRGVSNWIKFGVPVAVVVIIAAIVAGVVASKKNNDKDKDSSSSSASNNGDGTTSGTTLGPAAASSAVSAKLALGRFATATNSEFMVPIYPSTTNPVAFAAPTFVSSSSSNLAWPADPFKPANPSLSTVRTDRPRLIAPSYKWQALPNLIRNDPYLQGWNATIFGNASTYFDLLPVVYNNDGSSGILDNAREVKMRIKAFSYVFRMTNDTKWLDRAWTELQNAAGTGKVPFGPDDDTKWNPGHFLDTAELSAAFGIAYDWLYDSWTEDQKTQIRAAIVRFGLSQGITQFKTSAGWWKGTGIRGNWNCVCNGGLTLGALAILGDDDTGTASEILSLTVDNANSACVNAVAEDGSWAESTNYWYFGTTGHAEMASALLTATGSDFGLLTNNKNFYKTGLFHMYAYGATSLFNWGDHGPNKFSTTANSMFLYADQYRQPVYSLFQREQADAAEPWSMFWYDPSVSGAFWSGTPLDHFFDDALDQWASMRSSWTDQDALYLGIKGGKNTDHQTHNDLDVGTFVLDALGTRWAGELGSGDYNSPDYFDGNKNIRWQYYRKMTEGQNTILIGQANQKLDGSPTVEHDSSGTKQGDSTVVSLTADSTAFWKVDMTSAYSSASSVKRGVRLLNARRQVLLQDEITATAAIQWRMHTNATVVTEGTSATLTLGGKTMLVSILNSPSGAVFSKRDAQRLESDVTPPVPDQENRGVTVLTIDLPAGTQTLEVLFNPQWPNMADDEFVTPPFVKLDSWTLTSHN